MKLINNKKGFTLVELLAVIVVLAIVMIIAMPSVLDAMGTARAGAFRSYAKKVIGAAQSQYAADDLLSKWTTGTPNATASSTEASKMSTTNCKIGGVTQAECYCYPLPSLGLNTGNTYGGYVIITVADVQTRVPSYFITLTDNNQNFKDVPLASVDTFALTAGSKKTGSGNYLTCPTSFNYSTTTTTTTTT